MSVELVLKLTGRVPGDYYKLQRAWGNKRDGNFSDFDGKTIAGVRVHKHFVLPRNQDFPLEGLFAAIDKE